MIGYSNANSFVQSAGTNDTVLDQALLKRQGRTNKSNLMTELMAISLTSRNQMKRSQRGDCATYLRCLQVILVVAMMSAIIQSIYELVHLLVR